MTTSDDYVLGTYVRMYIEDIIRVTYDRCDVHMYIVNALGPLQPSFTCIELGSLIEVSKLVIAFYSLLLYNTGQGESRGCFPSSQSS